MQPVNTDILSHIQHTIYLQRLGHFATVQKPSQTYDYAIQNKQSKREQFQH